MSGGTIADLPAAVIIDRQRPENVEEYGAVTVEYNDGTQVDVKVAGAPEYTAASVTIGVGRLVEGAGTDLTESFSTTASTVRPSRTGLRRRTRRPTRAAAVPVAGRRRPDGVTLSWVEGPDWNGATNAIEGGWTLVLADATSGAEALRLDLGDPGEALVHADFDGRFWVGSFDPGGVLVVDTAASQPAVVDTGCAAGCRRLDRFGAQGPPAPATTTPPAPTTTQPVSRRTSPTTGTRSACAIRARQSP